MLPLTKPVETALKSSSTSWVWYFMTEIRGADNKKTGASCNLCHEIKKYSGNTTNFRTHLQRHHGITEANHQTKQRLAANQNEDPDDPGAVNAEIVPQVM